MPGREDLIQQNLLRARSSAEATTPQESAGKSSSGPVGSGGPKSFFGGNYDVYSKLESIGFQGKLGDASMRGSTAYIRVWKRGGVAEQTSLASSSELGFAFDYTGELSKEVFNNYGSESFQPLTFSLDSSLLSSSFDADKRLLDLSSQTPLTSVYNEKFNLTTSSAPTATTTTTPTTQSVSPTGRVVSANPSGFTSSLATLGRNVFGLALGRVPYVGEANASPLGTSAISFERDKVWQFLFNPSELEYELGPEFKNAEVWGVSDKANSGQPVHWTHNKNPQLKFNSILLNGYVFGRKVESLEKGLVDLFMARDGEGQHGPYILEFIWDKKKFGPCVIRNINIKEKMWDEGEVVNAEVSFTLEQIPEWTINDGAYVDVARPGRRPLQETPITTPTTPTAPTTPTTQQPPTAQPPGGGQNQPSPAPTPAAPAPTQASLSSIATKCRRLTVLLPQALDIQTGPTGLFGSALSPNQAKERLKSYATVYTETDRYKIQPLNAPTPASIESKILTEWKKRAGDKPLGNIFYPTTYANELLSRAASYLAGTINTQINSNTCKTAVKAFP